MVNFQFYDQFWKNIRKKGGYLGKLGFQAFLKGKFCKIVLKLGFN